jgi:hypothetical protein
VAASLAACQVNDKPPPPPPAAKDAAAASQAARPVPKRPKIELPPPSVPPPGAEAPPAPPEVERIDEFRSRIGQVVVDRQKRRVEAPGRVNMNQGILEYYAVASQGKLHESVLELLVQPSHLHLGLLLAGLDPNVYRDSATGARTVLRAGGRMHLFVEWTDPKSGQRKRDNAEAWLYNRKRRKAPPPQEWTFLGSMFWNGHYSADGGRSIVALIPDDTCVVGVMGDEGNPYRGDDLGYEVNTKIIPPVGTPVTLVFEADGPAPAPASTPAPVSAPASAPTP